MGRSALNTREFWLLCISSFLFMASFNMIIPELNDFISARGGREHKALNIALFAFAALISRPLSGKLTDTIGRIPVMIIGVVFCIVTSLIYPFVQSLTIFLILRFMHGFSTGFKPTGTTAYLADITPIKQRGEAMGLLGIAGSVGGFAFGPPIGSFIANEWGTTTMFVASSITALFSIAILFGMKETLVKRTRLKASTLRLNASDIFDRRAIPPSIVMILTVYGFGAFLIVTPDMCEYLGIRNKGAFFPPFVIMSIVTRVFAGRASDIYGRETVIQWGTLIMTGGLLSLALSEGEVMFYASAGICGLAAGLNSRTIFAWTADRAHPDFVGRAMGTMFIALEAGIIIGSLAGGYLYGNDPENIKYVFYIGAFFSTTALIYISAFKKRSNRQLQQDT